MDRYDLGNLIKIDATFTSAAGAVEDPTSVSLKVLPPGGPEAAPSPTRVSSGVYTYNLLANKEGLWRYRWEGAGAVTAASEGAFIVNPTEFYP